MMAAGMEATHQTAGNPSEQQATGGRERERPGGWTSATLALSALASALVSTLVSASARRTAAFALLPALLLGIAGCRSGDGRQLLLPDRSPMPNPVVTGPAATRPHDLGTGPFRDPSIHVGAIAAPHMFASGVGVDAISVVTQSSLPSSEILHARIADYDMTRHRFVPFVGRTSGCTYGVNVPVRGRTRDGSSVVVPVRFRFGLRTFYQDLTEQMEKNNVIALFDSRLDRDQTIILFGLLTRSCYIFHGIGIQPLAARPETSEDPQPVP